MWQVFRKAAAGWIAHRDSSSGAAVAFYTIFSLPPVVLVVLAVAGLIFGEAQASAGLFEQITGLVGEKSTHAIRDMIESASDPKSGMIALISGPVIFVAGATAVFAQLQTALNDIWGVRTESFSLWRFLRHRLVSFALILAMGFLLVVSLALDTATVALGSFLFGGWASAMGMWFLQMCLSIAILSVMFALMFKVLPDAVVGWEEAWFGGVATAVLFTAGKFAIGFYLAKTDTISTYGAPGTFIVVLLWVYYSSLIFLYGAELTRQWQMHRRAAEPPPGGA